MDRESLTTYLATGVDRPTLAWLLEADPALRWQVLRDLTDAPAGAVAEERARVAVEGWGARLLSLQREDGQWGDGERHPFWWTNLYSLIWLRDLGVDPESEPVRRMIARVRDRVTWGEWHGHARFFDGEVEPCINGRVVALGSYFAQPVEGVVDRLLDEQLADGGWNCEAERGSTRSSFHTTICVLEGLLDFERFSGGSATLEQARRRGEEYLLERQLTRRLSTGEVIDPSWAEPAFPPLWHYDLLRGLDYLRHAGREPDERARGAVQLLVRRRGRDGRWARAVQHEDTLYPEMAGALGSANRWVTLRAARVLSWFDPLGESP